MNKIKIFSSLSFSAASVAPWVAGYFAFATGEYFIAFSTYLVLTGLFLLGNYLLRKKMAKLNEK